MFSSRLKKTGVRCEAVVIERHETSVTNGSPGSPSARRVWAVTVEVRPGGGRAPFRVEEKVGVPIGSQPATTGTVVPAWVHPDKDKVHVEFGGVEALETGMNARLAASGIQVSVPEGVTDPVEIRRILTEQIEAQQRAQAQQTAGGSDPDGQ
jgi:hypothetical protein